MLDWPEAFGLFRTEVSTYSQNQGGQFDKALRLLLDTVLKAPMRTRATSDEQILELVERVKREDVERAVHVALIFCYEFNDRAGLPVDRRANIAPLAAFIADFNVPFSTGSQKAGSWELFVLHIRRTLSSRSANNHFRNWMILPPRLFRKAHSLAEEVGTYRNRQKDLPAWSKVEGKTAGLHRPQSCWLKECDQNVRWKQHCWSQCSLAFLDRNQFTNDETARSLNSGNCRGRLAYCTADSGSEKGKNGTDMSGGTPMDPDGKRDDSQAERRARAEAFASAQTSEDRIEGLVRDLVTPPETKARPAEGFGWGDLLPGVQYAGAALALMLVAGVSLVVLRPSGGGGETIVASLANDSLRSGTPTEVFLRNLPNELGATFQLSQGRVVLSTPAGDRLELSGILTNSTAAGGRLWIGTPGVSGKAQGGQAVTGTGRIRIRTRSAVELGKAKLEDLEWVDIQLELASGQQAGTLSLVLGTP